MFGDDAIGGVFTIVGLESSTGEGAIRFGI
jgi:hypothetical protein